MNVVVRRANTRLVVEYENGTAFSNANVNPSGSNEAFFNAGKAISALQSTEPKGIIRRETLILSQF